VDANIFIYAFTKHKLFWQTASDILERIENGEPAVTSILVQCEVCWVLEAMGRQGDIKPALEKMMSYKTLKIVGFTSDDMLVGAHNMAVEKLDFNDGVNLAIMMRLGINEVYSHDQRHLQKVDGLRVIFS
jgi:predicted nucleic acid-binding protein